MTTVPPAHEDDALLFLIDELFEYWPASGRLFWAERTADQFTGTVSMAPETQANKFNATYAGKRAGSVTPSGFRYVTHRNTHLRADRIAFALFHGQWPRGPVTHLDGDRSNDRAINLATKDMVALAGTSAAENLIGHPGGKSLAFTSLHHCSAWGRGSGRTCLPHNERPEGCLPPGAVMSDEGKWLLPRSGGCV